MPADKNDYLLAIDLGSSGPKVGLVTTDGRVIASEFEPVSLHLLPGGGAEQSADEWWSAIVQVTRKLLAQKLLPVENIAAVCCASLYSTTVAVGKDGRPLMNAIFWMDTRGAPYIQKVTGGPITIQGYGPDKLFKWLRLTGGIPTRSGKDSIAHILYIKSELPEVYRQTYKFLEPKDYINLRLTGRFAATHDSVNLHWLTDNRNIADIRWADRLISMAGLDREKLPDLVPAATVLGPLTREAGNELGLPESVPVVAGTTDAQSAAMGAGAVRDYQAHLYLGTSSWISCHVPFKRTDIDNNLASLPAAVPGKYYIANEQECAGVCLTFLRDHLVFPNDDLNTAPPPADALIRFDRMAERVPPGSDGVIFTPWLVGERTPVEDAWLRGGFHNLSLKTSRAQLVRAVFEGVAYNSRWLLACVEKFCRRRLEPINMIGGGALADVWCQIHADVLNRTIRQVKDPIRANLRGAALLAAAALGHISFDEISQRVEIAKTFRHNPENRRVYEAMFKEFLNIYRNNRQMYARLNRAA